MITISLFGPEMGRLGNQIFQFALLFSLHKSKGYEIHLPLNNGCQFWNCFDINNIKIFNYRNNDKLNICVEKNGACNFDPSILESKDNTIFHGHFQSYLYFDKYKKELIETLKFKNDIVQEGDSELHKFQDPISIHIRRTDYLSIPHFGNLIETGYYETAIQNINNNQDVLVFSDDVSFAKLYFKNKKNFHVINKNEYVSLYMMTKCNNHIIANSTFSWMGAYLSNKENITCPHTWWRSTHTYPNNTQRDITKKYWNRINVLF